MRAATAGSRHQCKAAVCCYAQAPLLSVWQNYSSAVHLPCAGAPHPVAFVCPMSCCTAANLYHLGGRVRCCSPDRAVSCQPESGEASEACSHPASREQAAGGGLSKKEGRNRKFPANCRGKYRKAAGRGKHGHNTVGQCKVLGDRCHSVWHLWRRLHACYCRAARVHHLVLFW